MIAAARSTARKIKSLLLWRLAPASLVMTIHFAAFHYPDKVFCERVFCEVTVLIRDTNGVLALLFDSLGRDARPTTSLRHLLDEFVGPGDGCIHVIEEARDVGLDFGGLAAKGGDGLSVQGVFQREHVIVQFV